MADRTINLKLKLVQASDTKKALDGLKSVSTSWDKVFGPNGDKPVKNVKRQVGELTRTWQDLGRAIKGAHENFKLGFDTGANSMRGLKGFTDGLDKATKKVFNLKNALMGTAVGAGAVWLGSKILEGGAQAIRTRKRLKREFGDEAGDIEGAAKRINFAAGIQDDEAERGLIPLAEQLQAIQGGAQFRGMKKPLTESQATALRKKNLNFGADLLKRVSTLVTDVEPDELGKILGDALAGPEGIRTMVSALNLSKRSKTLSQQNEKGEAYKVLSPEERKQFGITKKGQFLEQGDLVNLLLSRSGMTDKAALDTQKEFGHQVRQIKATLTDQLDEIGAGALDSLTEKLGKGATAAERLQNYLKSDEGKKTIDGIKDTVVKIVDGVAEIVSDLPKIGKWLGDHKTLLETLAAAYVAAKVAPGFMGVNKGVGAAADALVSKGVLSGTAGVAIKAIPLVGAGLAADAAMTTIMRQKNIGAGITFGNILDKDKGAVKDRLTEFYMAKIAEMQAQNAKHPAVTIEQMKDRPIQVTSTTVLQADGHTLAKVVTPHLVRQMDNRTGRGASPVSKE